MTPSRRPWYSFHWGFPLALLLILGTVAIIAFYSAQRGLNDPTLMAFHPSRDYAEQIGVSLRDRLANRFKIPSEILVWRVFGAKEADAPRCPREALYWFTFDSTQNVFLFHYSDTSKTAQATTWARSLVNVLPALLRERKSVWLGQDFGEAPSLFRLNGKVFDTEPRVVGLVFDRNQFRRDWIPRILEEARRDYPLLFMFTEVDSAYNMGLTDLAVLIRDADHQIIAQAGGPGLFANQETVKPPAYRKSFTLEGLGYSIDVIIPFCTESVWQWIVKRSFYTLILLWGVTLILWVRAEIWLKRSKGG